MSDLETKDQKFFREDGQFKAIIDVDVTRENATVPSIKECRHAVLQLHNEGYGYVIYDRLLCRIVNGVFYDDLQAVLGCAQLYNEDPHAPQDMSPNGSALGLIYPTARDRERR